MENYNMYAFDIRNQSCYQLSEWKTEEGEQQINLTLYVRGFMFENTPTDEYEQMSAIKFFNETKGYLDSENRKIIKQDSTKGEYSPGKHIYYHGDMSNSPMVGLIIENRNKQLEVLWSHGTRGSFAEIQIEDMYDGTGKTRIVTWDAYAKYNNAIQQKLNNNIIKTVTNVIDKSSNIDEYLGTFGDDAERGLSYLEHYLIAMAQGLQVREETIKTKEINKVLGGTIQSEHIVDMHEKIIEGKVNINLCMNSIAIRVNAERQVADTHCDAVTGPQIMFAMAKQYLQQERNYEKEQKRDMEY